MPASPSVGRRQDRGSDQPGLGLDGQVSLVTVTTVMDRLAGVAGLRIDRRDDPVLGDLARDAPRSLGLARFDVLSGNEGKQSDGVGLIVVERLGCAGVEGGDGVVHEGRDELGAL